MSKAVGLARETAYRDKKTYLKCFARALGGPVVAGSSYQGTREFGMAKTNVPLHTP